MRNEFAKEHRRPYSSAYGSRGFCEFLGHPRGAIWAKVRSCGRAQTRAVVHRADPESPLTGAVHGRGARYAGH
jgi:hypothetical protein